MRFIPLLAVQTCLPIVVDATSDDDGPSMAAPDSGATGTADSGDTDDTGDTGDTGGTDDTGGGGGGGTGSGALDVSPLSYSYGTNYLGCSVILTVVAENIGTASLDLSSVELKTGSAEIAQDTSTSTVLPVTLAAGDSAVFDIVYTPMDEYDDSAYFFLESSDPVQPTVMVTLEGSGSSYAEGSDSFVQTAVPDTTFPLTQPALEDTVEVVIDGVHILLGWSYDPSLNAVVFDPAYIPEPGASVLIDYDVSGC